MNASAVAKSAMRSIRHNYKLFTVGLLFIIAFVAFVACTRRKRAKARRKADDQECFERQRREYTLKFVEETTSQWQSMDTGCGGVGVLNPAFDIEAYCHPPHPVTDADPVTPSETMAEQLASAKCRLKRITQKLKR